MAFDFTSSSEEEEEEVVTNRISGTRQEDARTLGEERSKGGIAEEQGAGVVGSELLLFYEPFDATALARADFGPIGRQRAEEIVRGKPLGSFLLRDSTSHSNQKCVTAKENLAASGVHNNNVLLEDQKSGSFLIHYVRILIHQQKAI